LFEIDDRQLFRGAGDGHFVVCLTGKLQGLLEQAAGLCIRLF
jgi:hypothetical protein